MNVFEFKTEQQHVLIDLEAIQLVKALTYTEETYKANCGHGPGSGGIEFGRSEGGFLLTLALRETAIALTHSGVRQVYTMDMEQAWAKKLKLAKPERVRGFMAGQKQDWTHYEIECHSPKMQKFSDFLNALPNPFVEGRAFRDEYARLLNAWKACVAQRANSPVRAVSGIKARSCRARAQPA